ncbi:dipeptidase PepV [Chungangia koreensis]|uniref:Dipeptidase PepV n=1 Tax=Chungangia koreensis TaxID=752657 RepID=A0ABV8X1D0_9LACT
MKNWLEEALGRKDELMDDLKNLISIPSVLNEDEATEEAPFGPMPLKALNWVLKEGEQYGFTTKNIDNYAGHIEMGEGEELIGILGHVDVVPAGSGWTYEPYEGTVVEDKLFGRGAIDDKGPTMAAWLAMKMVKDAGIELDKRVRLIIGSDEESGFRCVKRYFEKEEMPTMGFAPDADFPIINAEKGIANLLFSVDPQEGEQETLLSFKSGHRSNMVPDYAEAKVKLSAEDLLENFNEFREENDVTGTIEADEEYVTVTLNGKSAHAMEPDLGVNAGVLLANFLVDQVQGGAGGTFLKFVVDAFEGDSRGHALKLEFSDEMSGDTTLNAGVLSFDHEKGGAVTVSMRYSVSYQFDEKINECLEVLKDSPVEMTVKSNSTPHFVDENDELIQTLKRVYERQTGEEATLLSIGGGTYARVMKKGVAFGMLFPGREDVAHQADEYVWVNDLIKAAAIYADAISELAGKKN